MKKYGLIFKIVELALILISVALIIWGFVVGFESKGDMPVDVLLKWAYCMVVITLLAILVFAFGVAVKNDPKVLVKYGIVLAGAAVLCLVAFVLAKGDMAHELSPNAAIPSPAELKLTDTMLNLTYITGAGAILSIIVGEIIKAVRNK